LFDLCELPLKFISDPLPSQLPILIKNIEKVIDKNTSIILIKANVYDIAFQTLKN